jgi:hypothetical protein
MIQIDGFPVYELGFTLGPILNVLARVEVPIARAIIDPFLSSAKESLAKNVAPPPQSYMPPQSKAQAAVLIQLIDEVLKSTETVLSGDLRGRLTFHIFRFNEMLAAELNTFDLYWIEPKLGYNTAELLTDGTAIFPKVIRDALDEKIKHEVREAARCLEYEVHSAVGFHILRAVEIAILDYFTIPDYERAGANNWGDYAKRLRFYKVHRKIVGMIDRLTGLHRNELMHAEAVLSAPEASMLFALMQEVLPVMIADVAKRKGAPIADFPILDDPRWQ